MLLRCQTSSTSHQILLANRHWHGHKFHPASFNLLAALAANSAQTFDDRSSMNIAPGIFILWYVVELNEIYFSNWSIEGSTSTPSRTFCPSKIESPHYRNAILRNKARFVSFAWELPHVLGSFQNFQNFCGAPVERTTKMVCTKNACSPDNYFFTWHSAADDHMFRGMEWS